LLSDEADNREILVSSSDTVLMEQVNGTTTPVYATASCSHDHDYSNQPLAVEEMLTAANRRIDELERCLAAADIY
jgi:hypothetical protein